MHAPILILVQDKDAKQAKNQARQYIDDVLITDGVEFDYHGDVSSWKEYKKFDIPRLITEKGVRKSVMTAIKKSQSSIIEQFNGGMRMMKENEDIYSIFMQFKYATSTARGRVFDAIDQETVITYEQLEAVEKNSESMEGDLYVCGFDIHY